MLFERWSHMFLLSRYEIRHAQSSVRWFSEFQNHHSDNVAVAGSSWNIYAVCCARLSRDSVC